MRNRRLPLTRIEEFVPALATTKFVEGAISCGDETSAAGFEGRVEPSEDETFRADEISPKTRAKIEKAIMRRARYLGRRELFWSYILTFSGFTLKARRLILLLRRQKARALYKIFSYAHEKLSPSRG